MTQKKALCSSCDIYCSLLVDVEEGRVVKVRPTDTRPLRANICMKGIHAPEGFSSPSRLMHPLRRVGERGSGQWEQVSWDTAMDEIAAKLGKVVAQYGPEALAVSTSQWNTASENGAGRRFMNHLGSPNWISGVALCAGNTAAINRMVYGWFPYPDYNKTNCIVLFGHNPKKHSWVPVYNSIMRAQERGAKLIVLDPRKSESAERADMWLPLKAGSDAAMSLGWLHVMLEEGLYDKAFVEKWTTGFDAFAQRVREFPLERVEQLTGVDKDLIRAAARLYATSSPSVIPWTPITDQQRNSTSAIRLQCALRALSGSLDVEGGDVLHGFNPDIVSESEMEMHGSLSQAQKDKQLGSLHHPAFTYRGTQALQAPTQKVWGMDYANLISGSYMANPSDTFRAMADGDPYPVKAFISLGNNSLMSYANMQLIARGMLNQDLVVVFEHVMTPTAQLADYVLPGDAWTERAALADGFGWTSIYRSSQKAVEPAGECRGVYDFWRGLAVRMGFEDAFPWPTVDDVLDYRVHKTGMGFNDFSEKFPIHMRELKFKKYEQTGFATPSGKVELYSSVLEDLGFDPLPYFREDPPNPPGYSLTMFMGVRDDPFFQTGQRHIPSLRRHCPEPVIFLHPQDAADLGIAEGDWVQVQTEQGQVSAQAAHRADMPQGLVRVPHGWWRPEAAQGLPHLSDAWKLADAQICRDDADFLDREQGIPHFKGMPCRVVKAAA